MIEPKFVEHIAEELEKSTAQVGKVIELLNSGFEIPYIARYGKDLTGNLNETQIEAIADRNTYFTALTDRRNYARDFLAQSGQLTDALAGELDACRDKTALEDIFLPHKHKKQRTRATVAREKGLMPLAEYIIAQEGNQTIEEMAAAFVRPEKAVASVEEAIEGARAILIEQFSLDRRIRVMVRSRMLDTGRIVAQPTKNAEGQRTKYSNYYDFSEEVRLIPSHRLLAVMRGVNEGILRMELALDEEALHADMTTLCLKAPSSSFEPHILFILDTAYTQFIRPALEADVIHMVHDRADLDAIRVFRENAHNILLSPPAGPVPVIGVAPVSASQFTVAVVGPDGALAYSQTFSPGTDPDETAIAFRDMMLQHNAMAVVVGNSQGSREAASFIRSVIRDIQDREPFCIFQGEAAASAYAGSKIGRQEFPDADASLRKAISLARRLQDPLSELVKIDPRQIGVGQYHHDVNRKRLRDGLNRTISSCVNRVGVNISAASETLLGFVCGIQPQTAANMIAFREKVGGFVSREQIKEVDGVGAKVFDQCSGFLRIPNAANPLDATGIHPSAYPVVEHIAESLSTPVSELVGNHEVLKGADFQAFTSETVGVFSLEDIRGELAKPGRDPRTVFRAPRFQENLQSVQDLEPDMVLEGIVTNVTDFGVFVDIGVSQDGLVHLSELANRFVRDPRTVAKVGDIVRVKVVQVDKELPRISLSMKAIAHARDNRRQPHARQDWGDGEATAPDAAATSERPARARHRPDEQRPDDSPRRERPARRDRGERRDSGERKGSGGRPASKGQRDRRPEAPKSMESEALVNTQLADQLAALREKFGR